MWKETWRRWALSGGCSAVNERRIAAVLDSWLPHDLTVTVYHALRGEPSLDAIVDRRRRWLVPRVEGDTMTFHEWDAETETLTFGLRQPTSTAPVVPASQIDVMVIPGLAFDRRGVRLGRGGGFYDRFLTSHPQIRTVGVITAARLVERLPRESHDATVDHIAIEAGVTSVGSG